MVVRIKVAVMAGVKMLSFNAETGEIFIDVQDTQKTAAYVVSTKGHSVEEFYNNPAIDNKYLTTTGRKLSLE